MCSLITMYHGSIHSIFLYIFTLVCQVLNFLHEVCNYGVEYIHAGIGEAKPAVLSDCHKSFLFVIFDLRLVIWHEDFFEFRDIFDSLIGSEVEKEFFYEIVLGIHLDSGGLVESF